MAAFAWCWHMPVVGLVVLAVAGAASQANVPLFISTCQRLMPRGEAMASALMMGVSWGIGGACPLLVALANTWCGQQATIVGLGVLLAPTAVLALWLPGVPSGLGGALRNRVDYTES